MQPVSHTTAVVKLRQIIDDLRLAIRQTERREDFEDRLTRNAGQAAEILYAIDAWPMLREKVNFPPVVLAMLPKSAAGFSPSCWKIVAAALRTVTGPAMKADAGRFPAVPLRNGYAIVAKPKRTESPLATALDMLPADERRAAEMEALRTTAGEVADVCEIVVNIIDPPKHATIRDAILYELRRNPAATRAQLKNTVGGNAAKFGQAMTALEAEGHWKGRQRARRRA